MSLSYVIAKPLFSNGDQKEASLYIASLKDLVIATQKTRGMTYTYLEGDKSVVFRIMDFRKEMKKALLKLELSKLGENVALKGREETLSNSLVRLSRKGMKMQSDEMFTEYTIEIENILILANITYNLSASDMDNISKQTLKSLLQVALPLTENLGQLRAFGSGSLAQMNLDNEVNPLKIDKIQYLIIEIENSFKKFKISTHTIMNTYDTIDRIELDVALKKSQYQIDKLLNLTRDVVLSKSNVMIKPNEYFKLATRAIESILKIYTIQNSAINEASKGWI